MLAFIPCMCVCGFHFFHFLQCHSRSSSLRSSGMGNDRQLCSLISNLFSLYLVMTCRAEVEHSGGSLSTVQLRLMFACSGRMQNNGPVWWWMRCLLCGAWTLFALAQHGCGNGFLILDTHTHREQESTQALSMAFVMLRCWLGDFDYCC